MFEERSLKLDLFALGLLAATLFLGLSLAIVRSRRSAQCAGLPDRDPNGQLVRTLGGTRGPGHVPRIWNRRLLSSCFPWQWSMCCCWHVERSAIPFGAAIGWTASLVGFTTFAVHVGLRPLARAGDRGRWLSRGNRPRLSGNEFCQCGSVHSYD